MRTRFHSRRDRLVHEALWQGVPIVAIPAAVDQSMNTDMLSRSEPASASQNRTQRPRHRAALGKLQPIGHLQTEIQQTGGADRAADAVEALIA